MFKSVGTQTTARLVYYKLTMRAFGSGELIKNVYPCKLDLIYYEKLVMRALGV